MVWCVCTTGVTVAGRLAGPGVVIKFEYIDLESYKKNIYDTFYSGYIGIIITYWKMYDFDFLLVGFARIAIGYSHSELYAFFSGLFYIYYKNILTSMII